MNDTRSTVRRLRAENAALTAERDEALAEVVRFADMAASKHGLIHTEAGGAFIQAVCRCGAFLCETGFTSYAAMLAKHIQAAEPTS